MFIGKVSEFIKEVLLNMFLIFFSFGLLIPWVIVRISRWTVNNAVIGGKRYYFNGSVVELIFKSVVYFVFVILTIIVANLAIMGEITSFSDVISSEFSFFFYFAVFLILLVYIHSLIKWLVNNIVKAGV